MATAYGKQLQAVKAKVEHMPERVLSGATIGGNGSLATEDHVARASEDTNEEAGASARVQSRGRRGMEEGRERREPREERAPSRVESDLLQSEIQELADILDQPLLPEGVGQ